MYVMGVVDIPWRVFKRDLSVLYQTLYKKAFFLWILGWTMQLLLEHLLRNNALVASNSLIMSFSIRIEWNYSVAHDIPYTCTSLTFPYVPLPIILPVLLMKLSSVIGICCNLKLLKWLRTIHVWLHHKNLNVYFSKTVIVNLLKEVSIYKVFVYLSSPANQSAQLLVKRELEIQGVWRNTKRVPTSTTLNFGIATI